MSFERKEQKQDNTVEMLNDIESMLARRLPLNKDDVLLVEFKQIAERYCFIHSDRIVPQ